MKLNYFSQRTRPAAEVTIPSLISGAAKRDTWVANIINGQSEQEHVVTELSGSLAHLGRSWDLRSALWPLSPFFLGESRSVPVVSFACVP